MPSYPHTHPPHTHHVPALLVVRVWVEEVVAHVLQYGFDVGTRQVAHSGGGVSYRHLIHQMITRDGLPWQNRSALAEAG